MADNALQALPSLQGATSLHSLWAYGNQLQSLPVELAALPSLRRLWVEDNPPVVADQAAVLVAARDTDATPLVIGVDAAFDAHSNAHIKAPSNVPTDAPPSDQNTAPPNPSIAASARVIGGPGYFKLAEGPLPHKPAFTSDDGRPCVRTLVVAFGSAPGTPNWGGLLSRVYAAAAEDQAPCEEGAFVAGAQFDVLYVVDPCRAWYGGGDDGWEEYERRLRACVAGYERVVMLGDSMGATAALLASPLATHVLAFCPQVCCRLMSCRLM